MWITLLLTFGGVVRSETDKSLKVLWKQTLDRVETRVERDEFENWFRPLNPVSIDNSEVEIAVPNRLFASWVEENYLDVLASCWVEASGRRTRFSFTVNGDSVQGELFKSIGRKEPKITIPHFPKQNSKPLERYNFSNFVIGPANQFAHAASVAVSKNPGSLYNPFFIYGGVGLGKTHLANAIGNAVLEQDPSRRVMLLSADMFTNKLVEAIAANKAPAFKTRMRRMDMIIVDDVQFLAGRERTQEEFFHIFNALYESEKQIVLTSDKFPAELDGVEERLCSRFGWGLVADIQAPDFETRTAILKRKAGDEGIDLSHEVAAIIAGRIESNIRDLEGALTRTSAYASLNQRPLSPELVTEMLSCLGNNSKRQPTLEEIENGVSLHFGLKTGELSARRRTKKVAEARQVAMFIMRNHAGASYPVIGTHLGGRDHSTVIHACKMIEKRRRSDPRFRRMIETVSKNLGCIE